MQRGTDARKTSPDMGNRFAAINTAISSAVSAPSIKLPLQSSDSLARLACHALGPRHWQSFKFLIHWTEIQ